MMVVTRFIVLSSFILTAVHAAQTLTKGQTSNAVGQLNLDGTSTKSTSIANTAANIDQKTGAPTFGPPNQPIAATIITAKDGQIEPGFEKNSTSSTSSRRAEFVPTRFARDGSAGGNAVAKRDIDGFPFEQVFSGTGIARTDRDAAIQGTAFLTFTVVTNATYNIDDCLAFCNNIPQCVFVNLYYEFNNPGLDAGGSNLKCVAYSDVHSATEKTNFGGQELPRTPPPLNPHLTFIQDSSGFAATSLVDPDTPDGYELAFGPLDGASQADGFMGFVFLDHYDVATCAAQCDERGADPVGGVCQFFNIWRAVVDGTPTTYTCAMYFAPTDASTATNTGQGDLTVTFSRGYTRVSAATDGGFEDFTCVTPGITCFEASVDGWTTSSPGSLDALVFNNPDLSHSGNTFLSFGSADGSDALSGTVTSDPLNTVAGTTYLIQFWQTSNFNTEEEEAGATLSVSWNGEVVKTVTGFTADGYERVEVQVVAVGGDVLSFEGGAFPAYTFVDDVSVFVAPAGSA